jgi:hypothetical protein
MASKQSIAAIAVSLVLLCLASAQLRDSDGERAQAAALLALRNSIVHDPYRLLEGWEAGTHPCGGASSSQPAWRGLLCDSPRGSVLELDLGSSRLMGYLVPDLANLTSLRKL